MTLQAGAFLALWNGVSDAALVPEYEAWHALEHVPERVGSPGFVAAYRYAAQPGQAACPAYFTLYELQSLDALGTPQYQDLLDHPTPWSARMRAVLTDFCREPCQRLGGHGQSRGGCLATLQLSLPTPQSADALDAALQQLVAQGYALHVSLGQSDGRSSHPLDSAAPQPSGMAVVVLLEHVCAALLQTALAHLSHALPAGTVWRASAAHYQLQSSVHQKNLAHPPGVRPAPRSDLRARFSSGANA
jgi:hypothetical protein